MFELHKEKITKIYDELYKDLYKFIEDNGGIIKTDKLAREIYDADPIYAYVFWEEPYEDRNIEVYVSAVKIEDDDIIIYVSPFNDEFDEEYDEVYALQGSMLLLRPTLDSLCEGLPLYVTE